MQYCNTLIFRGNSSIYGTTHPQDCTNSIFQNLLNMFLKKIEGRVASDEDLKLSDTLRYYMRDTAAAKLLLFRRLKALHAYETANRTLEKARARNKDVHAVSFN